MKPLLAALLATTALPAFAETFTLDTKVTEALITGQGGVVTYAAPLSLTPGLHTLVATLPFDGYSNAVLDVRFGDATGVRVVSQASTTSHATPIRHVASAKLQAAQDALDAALAAQRSFEQSYETKQSAIAAAELQIELANSTAKAGFGKQTEALQADQIAAVAAALSDITRNAQQTIAQTRTELAAMDPKRQDLREDVAHAAEVVKALEPASYEQVQQVTTQIEVTQAQDVTVEFDNLQAAYWQPSYSADLTQTDATGTLQLHRTAVVSLSREGEKPLHDWTDVAITLSTANLQDRTNTNIPYPQLKRLVDEVEMRKSVSARSDYGSSVTMRVAEPVPAPMAEASDQSTGADFAGQTLLFNLGGGHSIDWTTASTTFNIDTLTFPVDLYAMANAAQDTNAFLYTDLKNDTGGILLEGQVKLTRDGTTIGTTYLPRLSPNQTEPIGLGPLYGIRLQRDTLNVAQGDSGFITSKSEVEQSYKTTLFSALDYDMPLRLLDVIPTSEDDDLVVRLQARPTPDETNRKGQRGVLVWNLDLAAGATQEVTFGYQMKWPSGKIPVPN